MTHETMEQKADRRWSLGHYNLDVVGNIWTSIQIQLTVYRFLHMGFLVAFGLDRSLAAVYVRQC